MQKSLFILAWITSIWLLAGCAPSRTAPAATSPNVAPTTHPIFSSDAGEQPVDEPGPVSGTAPETQPEELAAAGEIPSLEISDTQVRSGDDDAIISWVTSRPAVSALGYGRTEMYETGSLGDDLPLTQHAVTLSDLEPETTYYYQITAVDSAANVVAANIGSFTTGSLAPEINIWYGLDQKYGNIGIPQQWFNIVGTVFDKDGIDSLTYSLNGGPETKLSIGPDLRRLAKDGDFNVDIHQSDLLAGENEVVITAIDSLDYLESVTVKVNKETDTVWPGNYTIDWQTVSNIQDVAQVVDGLWQVDDGALRIASPNYDRLVAIGDITWTDYEIQAPITLHSVNDAGFNMISNGPAIGLLVRWTGHTDIPIPGWQPKVGWKPFGAIAWYWWQEPAKGFWRLEGTDAVAAELAAAPLQFETPYIYKLRVETVSETASLYSFKVWPVGQDEPADWKLSAEIAGPPNGSLLLLAHQVDASFGDITVTQLAPPTAAPVLPAVSGSPVITNTLPITSTLPITGTSPITATSPITGTGSMTNTTPITDTTSLSGG